MKDLFGFENDGVSRFALFHDESECNKSNFLYHGFLFVRNEYGRKILDNLKDIKQKYNKGFEEIHFHDLYHRPDSPHGIDTKIAIEWLYFLRECLEKDFVKFYFFGADKNNIKNFWNREFDKKLYLRFFEIGLKSSIRWFNIDVVSHIFFDEGRHDDGRKEKIEWISNYFFDNKFLHEINHKNIFPLNSAEKESNSEFSNFIQAVDILLGSVRLSFAEPGKNQYGQRKCVESFIDIVERFNNQKRASNINSKYWKRFCIQFFPTPSDITKEEFLSDNIESIKKRGGFYCDRLTYDQKLAQNSNLTLF